VKSVNTFSITVALFTSPISGAIDVGIFWGELMAMFAMRLARVLRGMANAAENVFLARHGVKMGWIHAGSVAAEMIQGHSLGYWADKMLVGHPMHPSGYSPSLDKPVSIPDRRANPSPASVA